LLGCALGIERGDKQLLELDAALRLGVRVEHPGRVVTDYQTITDYLPTAGGEWKLSGSKTASSLERAQNSNAPATIISPRQYLEDAAFLAAFEEKSGGRVWLDKCAEALQSPRWTLYLGRKCCVPTRPIFESIREDCRDIEDALRRHSWDWRCSQRQLAALRKKRDDGHRLRLFIEDSNGSPQQDALAPGTARVYGFRNVRSTSAPLSDLWRDSSSKEAA
jgi:CRISPR system Cascade subunit CasD